jgi:TRAP-type C4-dicarboxylate transport system substrate-binding protein
MKSATSRRMVCIVVCGIVMVLGTLLWGGHGPKTAGAITPIELKLTIKLPIESPGTKDVLIPFLEYVEKESGNRIKFTLFPSSQLAPPPQFYDICKEGVVDIAEFGVGMAGARFPAHLVFLLPCIFPYPGSMVAQATEMAVYKKYPQMYNEFRGTKALGFTFTNTGHIHSVKKPIRKLSDFNGVIMVGTSPASAAIAKGLGATPETLPTSEIYEALVKGVVDAIDFGYAALFSFGWGEVVKYTTEVGIDGNTNAWLVNAAKWNSLPKDLQKLLSTSVEPPYKLPEDEKARWVTALQPVWGDWIKKADAAGYPGKAILDDCRAFSKKYTEQKWPSDKDYEKTLSKWGMPVPYVPYTGIK